MRTLLIPFAIIYNLITSIRNWLYDSKIWQSKSYDFPVIGVGNLKTGGTGKTPMVIYLLAHIRGKNIATLSRGYGRKTKGFRFVNENDEASQVGDEPALIKAAMPKALVAVDENRVHGITSILSDTPSINTVILDDVFQHRAVKPGHMILLSTFDDLYTKDLILPAGRLREARKGARRADTIVVTKCPRDLSRFQRETTESSLSVGQDQRVFFAYEQYGSLQSLIKKGEEINLSEVDQVLLVTGIAKTDSILSYFENEGKSVQHLEFRDHHTFTKGDLDSIKQRFENLPTGNNVIATTQKDAQRLHSMLQNENFAQLPIFALDHQMELLEQDREAFQLRLDEYINSY